MPPRLTRFRTPALIAACVAPAAVVGVVFAPAGSAVATARNVVLGGRNTTTATTIITDTAGTPLALNAKAGSPPLAVNATKVVTRLNADYVDGYHASSFAKVTGKTGIILTLDEPAQCPKGTVLTGGGGLASSGALGYTGPALDDAGAFIPGAWQALDAAGADAYSLAVCYSPTGAPIPGAVSGSALARVTSSLRGRAAAPGRTPVASGTTSPSPAAPTPSASPSGQ